MFPFKMFAQDPTTKYAANSYPCLEQENVSWMILN